MSECRRESLAPAPLEASAQLSAVQKLLAERTAHKESTRDSGSGFDRNSIRAAVTLALDAAMPILIEELTERVLLALARSS